MLAEGTRGLHSNSAVCLVLKALALQLDAMVHSAQSCPSGRLCVCASVCLSECHSPQCAELPVRPPVCLCICLSV
jgi:hypothetical protein